MAPFVYLLCTIASFICMMMLIRAYLNSRQRLLIWSSLCFLGLTANNVLLFVDAITLPDVNLSIYRGIAGMLGIGSLLYGLIFEAI